MGLAPEVKVALERMHADLSASSPVTEVTLHAGSHGWIFGRKSGARGLYLLLDGREYAWSEVQHEVAALLNGPHFSSVFLE